MSKVKNQMNDSKIEWELRQKEIDKLMSHFEEDLQKLKTIPRSFYFQYIQNKERSDSH